MIAAGGRGARLQAGAPKQYLKLLGRTLLEHAMEPFLQAPWIEGIVVVTPPGDRTFASLPCAKERRIRVASGGANRAESVLAGLQEVAAACAPDHANPFMLVHDAARPCLRGEELERLREQASDDDGGLLASPVADTLKRAESGRSAATVDRRELWRAQTPQLFRLELLTRALRDAIGQDLDVTDEARAMEAAGYRPRLVAGHEGNIKVTTSGDLPLAEFWLRRTRSKE